MPAIHPKSNPKNKSNFIKSEESDDSEPEWLPRTNIVITPGSRSIGLQAQLQPIKDVLCSSFRIGTRKMISDDQYSPLADDGLDVIAADALIDAADDLGYGGGGNISDRLEHSSEYSRPLRDYVSFFLMEFYDSITHI